jgi:hypothetical protein
MVAVANFILSSGLAQLAWEKDVDVVGVVVSTSGLSGPNQLTYVQTLYPIYTTMQYMDCSLCRTHKPSSHVQVYSRKKEFKNKSMSQKSKWYCFHNSQNIKKNSYGNKYTKPTESGLFLHRNI